MKLKVKSLLMGVVLLPPVLATAQDKPNIVWIVSEDNSKHYMKLFDANGAETPQIAEMAKDGLIFDRAFSNAPVSSVARSTLITGCYAPRIGAQYHRKNEIVPMPDGLQMFPAYLRRAGYYTTNKSKKDYNVQEAEDVWDESSRKASWEKRAEGQPFFHQQNIGVCHENSLHFKKDKMENKKTKTDPDNVFIAPIHPQTETFKYTYATYHDRMLDVDKQVGQIIDKLKENGLLENTFIFYFGDHGGVLPGSKGYIYERGLHVPLVVRIPEKWKHLVNFEKGERVNGFVSFIDFAPTVLHLAGVDVPEQMDGIPFLGKDISKETLNNCNVTYGYADRFDEKYDLVRSVRRGKYKYMRNYQPFNPDGLYNFYRYKMLAYKEWRELYENGKLNKIQSQFFEARPAEVLYDVEADPYETKNLATDPAYAKELSEMRNLLTDWVKGMPDLSFLPESFLISDAFNNPVGFGENYKEEIAELIDIADISLKPIKQSGDELKNALYSENAWQQYWGLIVCSSFGKEAKKYAKTAKQIANSSTDPLVRIRAAEFLALINKADPIPVFADVLANTEDAVEAALILNSLTVLLDSKHIQKNDCASIKLNASLSGNKILEKRIEYLGLK